MAIEWILGIATEVGKAITIDFIKDKVLEIGKKPVKTYEDALRDCIYDTIDEFHKKSELPEIPTDKFPFYYSQDLMIALSRTMLFEDNPQPLSIDDFEDNEYFLPFLNEDVKDFYNLFLNKATSNEVLKEKFIEENFKKRIFKNSGKLDLVVSKLDMIIDKIETVNFKREQGKELSAKLPLLYGDKIVKRENDLEDVRKRLLNNKQLVLVNGMGGIGKTTLAQMYVTEYYSDYKHLLWVNINSEDFISDFNNTEGLGESLKVSLEGKNPEQYFNALIVELKNLSHNDEEQSLMIIDNAELNITKYQDYFPHPPHWHVLATSRKKIEDFDVKELDFLNEEEAIKLFKLHYKREKISEDEIKEIVKTLEYHTLTIEILAKTAQNDGLNVQETVNTIATNYDAEVDARHADKKIRKITSYLSSIFNMNKLSDEELWLLQQFYFLPPQFHTIDVIEDIFGASIQDIGIKTQRVLTKLVRKGWLLYNTELESYRLHRIIGDVLEYSKKITFETVKKLVKSMTLLMHIDQSKDNPINKFKWILFGKRLLNRLDNLDNIHISWVEKKLADILKYSGDYQGAKVLLEKALASIKRNLGEENPKVAGTYSDLGQVLKELGDYHTAKELFEKARYIAGKGYGEEHPETITYSSNLAVALNALGDYKGAKSLLEKVVELTEREYGKKHPKTSIRYSNLAHTLMNLGDYQGAKQLLQKVMESTEENFGKEHPFTLVCYSDLSSILIHSKDYQGAKTLLEKAKNIAENILGETHPHTVTYYSNLGVVLKNLGDYQEAKSLLEKAIDLDEKKFGDNHPVLAIRYSNLASVLKGLGDHEGAKSLLEKAMVSDEKNFGSKHPTTATSYVNLALVLKDLGDYQKAKFLLEKAVKTLEESLGGQNPKTINIMKILESVLTEIENKEKN